MIAHQAVEPVDRSSECSSETSTMALWGAFIVGVAVNCLSEFKALSIGRDSCLVCKPNKLLMAGAVIDTRGKPMTAMFLNQYNFWLYSKYVSFDPPINVVLKKKKERSLLQQIETIYYKMQRKREGGVPTPSWCACSTTPTPKARGKSREIFL